jgi:hypothetical protein
MQKYVQVKHIGKQSTAQQLSRVRARWLNYIQKLYCERINFSPQFLFQKFAIDKKIINLQARCAQKRK